MSGSYEVRAARYDDPAVVALTSLVQDFYREIYGGPDSSPMSPEEFAPPHGRFFLGSLDGRGVAMGGWRFLNLEVGTARRPVELKRMFVHPDARGHGFGQLLLRALEHSAAEAGADWVMLQTGPAQVAAQALYRRAGYRPVPSFGHYADHPGVVPLGRPLSEPRASDARPFEPRRGPRSR